LRSEAGQSRTIGRSRRRPHCWFFGVQRFSARPPLLSYAVRRTEADCPVKLADIRPHLRPYSIVQRRKTTINHAFASPLAPCDEYDEERLARAMAALGQDDLDALRCVYYGAGGETWDHLVGLVKNSEPNGYEHQVGNLVPCCRACN